MSLMKSSSGPLVCAVDGCGRPRRAYQYCAKHGVAVRKYGDPLGASPRNRRAGERFGHWTLIERVPTVGWRCRCDCGHEQIVWLSSITSGRSTSCGDTAHHPESRRGNRTRKPEPSYGAVHRRLRVDKGPASAHCCVDCGAPASDWSYDGQDPDERIGTSWFGKPIAYSLTQTHYQPRCRSCHKVRDIASAKAST
jgi:hypothetical protein